MVAAPKRGRGKSGPRRAGCHARSVGWAETSRQSIEALTKVGESNRDRCRYPRRGRDGVKRAILPAAISDTTAAERRQAARRDGGKREQLPGDEVAAPFGAR